MTVTINDFQSDSILRVKSHLFLVGFAAFQLLAVEASAHRVSHAFVGGCLNKRDPIAILLRDMGGSPIVKSASETVLAAPQLSGRGRLSSSYTFMFSLKP